VTAVDPAQQHRPKALLILMLAFTGGWVDAIGYHVLLQMFTAHMSGNSISLTVAVGLRDWAGVFHRAFPIPLFVLGIALGGVANRVLARRGVRSVFVLTLALEALLLLLFAVLGSPVLGPDGIAHDPAWRFYALAALPVLAMGLQNGTLHRVGGQTIRTTFISGVLTNFVDELVKCLFWLHDRGATPRAAESASGRRALLLLTVWLCYLTGGVLGILAELSWHLGCLAVPIGCLLLVMAYDLAWPLEDTLRQENGLRREAGQAKQT
jgi:uncharacterized membrane protein YoaK (UPF0700 family)